MTDPRDETQSKETAELAKVTNQRDDFRRQLTAEREARIRAEALLDDTRRANESLRSATPRSEPANARAVAEVVLDNLPYLENLIDLRGHESGLLKNHPRPCAGHDFCLMRQAQKGADAIRTIAALPEAPLPEQAVDDRYDYLTGREP